MSHIFVSYARKDLDFVDVLTQGLRERGKQVWVDREGIRDAERFPESLERAIDRCEAFVFVISPQSVASRFCATEVGRAVELNKRIVPLLLQPVPDDSLPGEVRYRNWIPVTTDNPNLERITAAVDTDLDWEQRHARLTVRALEWQSSGHDHSYLLRGADLTGAESWLAEGVGKRPGPTEVEQRYIMAGRGAATRRQRRLITGISVVAVVAVLLLVFAFVSRKEAVDARTRATAQLLAAESIAQQTIDPERAILLAEAAVRDRATYGSHGTMFALRAAIDASPLQQRYPDAAGRQTCEPVSPPSMLLSEGAPGLAVRPDAHQLAEGLCNGTVRLVNPVTGSVEHLVKLPAHAIQLAYSADGSTLAVSAGPSTTEHLYAVDTRTGAVMRKGPKIADPADLFFVPGTSRVAFVRSEWFSGSSELVEWDARTGTVSYVRPRLSGLSQLYSPVAAAVSPDGRRVLVADNQAAFGLAHAPGLVSFRTSDGRDVRTAAAPLSAVSFSPDGRSLAVATQQENGSSRLELWNPATLRPERILVRDNATQITCIAFSPDGRRLAYADQVGGGAVLDLTGARQVVRFVGQKAPIHKIAFSSDGGVVYTAAANGSLLAWRTNGRDLAAAAVPGTAGVRIEPTHDGGYVSLVDQPEVVAQRWTRAGTPVGGPLTLAPTSTVNASFLGGAGDFAAVIPFGSAHDFRTATGIQVYDVATHHRVLTSPPDALPTGALPALGPGGGTAALALPFGGRYQLDLENLRTGLRHVLGYTSCRGAYESYAFDPSGSRLAAVTRCGEVSVYDARTGRRLSRRSFGVTFTGAFSSNGTQFAVLGADGTVTVIDADTGRTVARLTDTTGAATTVAYSPDGRYLAVGGAARVVEVYDARTFSELRAIVQPSAVQQVVFSADSHDVLALGADDVVRRWDACTECENPRGLLALAAAATTRSLTAAERREFDVN